MGAAFLAAWGSAILGCAPFVLASAVIAHLPLPRISRLVPLLGCGCAAGPSAISLPGAFATAITFGVPFALLRFTAACVAARLFHSRANRCPERAALDVLHGLLLPALGAAVLQTFSTAAVFRTAPVWNGLAGAAVGFLAAPCALAAPQIAASLRAFSPYAALGFLCVAGVADVRAFGLFRGAHRHGDNDAFAFVLLAAACALTALRGGGGLVAPSIALALWFAAPVCAIFAFLRRFDRAAHLRFAPAIALAATFVAAPPPAYHATETTLTDAFAGERVTFTGIVTRTHEVMTLVRYAITCCRADAAPVVVRLERPVPLRGWVRAEGVLVETAGGLALRSMNLKNVSAPADPFVYR